VLDKGGAVMLRRKRFVDRMAASRREPVAAEHIPCSTHVAPNVVKTSFGDYLQVIRLGGISFETADENTLNACHELLNVLWRNIASPNIAVWTHVVRRRERTNVPEDGRSGFAEGLYAKYTRRLAGETLMINELFVAVVYRPRAGMATGAVSRLLANVQKSSSRLELAEALEVCEKLSQTLRAALARYEPETLGSYRMGDVWYSSLLEYMGLLVNGEWRSVPLPRGACNEVLATTRLFFGTEAIEYRLPSETRVGAMLGIKEYASPTAVGMYDRLLSAPFPLVLTQSFVFLAKQTSQALLQRQFHRMMNAGDFAVSQAEELKEALDALSSNDFVLGDHHFSLQVLCDVPDGDRYETGPMRLKVLNEHVASARALLADTGVTVAREDLALEAAFWAQLPGNFSLRPRKAPITSRNFAAMAPFHNFPSGRATGNYWGAALTLLITGARSPYYFSLHASDPVDREATGPKDTGHTFICGPTGSGKTVFIGFLVAMLRREGVTQVIFDKDRGLEILVRALGGEYLPVANGVPTGFNPLQLPATATHIEFLRSWLRTLARPSDARPLGAREEADLDLALHGALVLDPAARRLSRLIEFLDPTDPEGVHARLARWCAVTQGDYAWVFDNPEDSVIPRMSAHPLVGFDVTDFLGHEVARAPVTLYLFHLVRQLLDGRKLVCWMDEFWRLLADPAFESFAKDAPKTWRKLNGVMCVATQSASDVLQSPISRTIIEQTPTKVFFPNINASAAEYAGVGLTAREIKLVKEQISPGSRRFLVKQGAHSVVCQLDLAGFEGELAVISGRLTQISRMEQLMATKGADPALWLPPFMEEE
jgi:type IV secretion system protein VirB4